jgi:Peptidase family M23
MPITYIPDWSKPENTDKTKRFEDIAISEYLPIPLYDQLALQEDASRSKNAMIMRYTYVTGHMGSYRLNYRENDGSHIGVDIRAPIGTPVLAIANWVIVRTVEADSTGNRYVVIRHDGVPAPDGTTASLYSGYLHLSAISVTEGSRIRKGEMLGRVGMSGITTTPHLHIQIDKSNAPFHPYWPFSSADSRSAGLSFFESINAGLGKERVEQYSVHPMTFINTYLGGTSESQRTFASAPIVVANTPVRQIASTQIPTAKKNIQVASYISEWVLQCQKSRYTDVTPESPLGRALYPLVDDKCLYQEGWVFDAKRSLTLREALVTIMDYYRVDPATGTSHFLDIPIGDILQGYAIVAYRRGILATNYAYPDKLITKEEFIDLIVKVGWQIQNPSSLKIYNDVTAMNPYYDSIQSYGLMTRARGGKFSGSTLMTRWLGVQILSTIEKKR